MSRFCETEFVLPNDIIFTPTAALPAQLYARLHCSQGDVAITRPLSRRRSKILSAELAGFLGYFASPQTFLDAIIKCAATHKYDPEELIDTVGPVVLSLIEQGFLAPVGSETSKRPEPLLTPGDQVGRYTVDSCVQILDDSEVYRALFASGEFVALKFLRADSPLKVVDAIDREAFILERLSGRIAPRLFSTGLLENRKYVATEWIPGLPPLHALELSCPGNLTETSAAIRLDLAREILQAYAQIHSEGVLHGDVHPRNVLLQQDGGIRLIDFGLGYTDGCDGDPPRGGIHNYLEPEYAAAILAKEHPPRVTPAGEQYSVAALVYQILTGGEYLDFSPCEVDAFRQIVNDPPRSMHMFRLLPQIGSLANELESILNRALSKRPEERFGSMEQFRAAFLQSVSGRPSLRLRTIDRPLRSKGRAQSAITREFLKLSEPSRSALGRIFHTNPSCSVNHGAAGIAFALYRMSVLQENPEFLAKSDVWITNAINHIHDTQAFYSDENELGQDLIGNISLYHAEPGVHCVRAMISAAMGDFTSAVHAIDVFLALSARGHPSLELTVGSASTLIGCCLIIDCMPQEPYTAGIRRRVQAFGDDLAKEISARIEHGAELSHTRGAYLGMAHGWAGVLYALVSWNLLTQSRPAEVVVERLDQLAALATNVGSGLYWPRKLGTPEYWPGWCHGAAGYVHLWTSAQQLLPQRNYAGYAQCAGLAAFEAPVGNPNLCCGTVGRAYAMLRLYRGTSDRKWLDRAQSLSSNIAGIGGHSLYKGITGAALLLTELTEPGSARMPILEMENCEHVGQLENGPEPTSRSA